MVGLSDCVRKPCRYLPLSALQSPWAARSRPLPRFAHIGSHTLRFLMPARTPQRSVPEAALWVFKAVTAAKITSAAPFPKKIHAPGTCSFADNPSRNRLHCTSRYVRSLASLLPGRSRPARVAVQMPDYNSKKNLSYPMAVTYRRHESFFS